MVKPTESRHDRHPARNFVGTGDQKKHGGGGKYTWGKIGDEANFVEVLDKGDPNYEDQEEKENDAQEEKVVAAGSEDKGSQANAGSDSAPPRIQPNKAQTADLKKSEDQKVRGRGESFCLLACLLACFLFTIIINIRQFVRSFIYLFIYYFFFFCFFAASLLVQKFFEKEKQEGLQVDDRIKNV